VLAHITSLPDRTNPGEPGTMHSALSFIDWLHDAGVRYWQILPINPTDQWGSPYAGLSAFAGNTALMPSHNSEALRLFEKNVKSGCRFVRENAHWLEPYACFTAIKELLGDGSPWWEWPEKYRSYTPELLGDKALKPGIYRCMALQMLFQEDWEFTRDYANEHGIQIIGDMPMYISADSADVWAHQEIFNRELLAGAPPDPLGPEGQLWGNPTFRWDVVAEQGFSWWLDRLARMFDLYDYVRLDHFIGFSSYYGIPQGKTALDGSWYFGPGKALFQAAYDKFGPLPLIAEDLGTISPAVRALAAEVGAPGMAVVQFADSDVRKEFRPAPGTIAFTGTHDTATILEWVETHFGLVDPEAHKLAAELCARVVSSSADVAILPLQDVLLLGVEGRMNRPGVASGNWSWRANVQAVMAVSDRLAHLVELHKNRGEDRDNA
jgi:4-alpha-glucanotransferase